MAVVVVEKFVAFVERFVVQVVDVKMEEMKSKYIK
jgi:hypothetical protein